MKSLNSLREKLRENFAFEIKAASHDVAEDCSGYLSTAKRVSQFHLEYDLTNDRFNKSIRSPCFHYH